MALPGRPAIASLFTCLHSPRLPVTRLFSFQQVRTAVAAGNASKAKRKDKASQNKKKKKGSSAFKQPDLRQADQFTLCDAMRYIRAFEVGRKPTSSKYEMHVRFRTQKSGPVVRNRLRLPHPVDTSVRICAICPPDSKHATAARSAGAVVVGEDEVFAAIKDGKIEFDRCVCHADSLAKLNKAGIARILGPRGLMPSAKMGTVVKDVGSTVKDMMGGSEYRERMGVVRMAIGQLGFTPEEMQKNIRFFMESVKKDCALLSDKITKDIHEVVLSSTNSPGFTLNGDFKSDQSVSTAALSTL